MRTGKIKTTHETRRREVSVRSDNADLAGTLAVPEQARGLVIFAHGSGSGRFSPRNQFVASELNARGLATLLFDLLTRYEERLDALTRHLRFDIALLSRRLTGTVDWAQSEASLQGLPVGLFGASTGAAAALVTASERQDTAKAVVSRGGRPDLAGDALARVRAPVLLIVGGQDDAVLDLNRQAARVLGAQVEVAVVPGATHLFEEPGALDEVAKLAGEFFARKLGVANRRPDRPALSF
jgi:dienelactone hydrolase